MTFIFVRLKLKLRNNKFIIKSQRRVVLSRIGGINPKSKKYQCFIPTTDTHFEVKIKYFLIKNHNFGKDLWINEFNSQIRKFVNSRITFVYILMILLLLIFIFSNIFLLIGFKFFFSGISVFTDSIKISVVTAAKNEEKIITNFISSIKDQDYPEDNFELILVDDNSTDNTYELACRLIDTGKNFRLIKAGTKNFEAKRGALFKGIEASRFPFIIITDADCLPSANWIKACAGQFAKGNEFIFGVAPFYIGNNFINKISCFENLKNQFLSFSLASLRMPYSCSARNMGFSKEAFYAIGGYTNSIDSLSGDDDLLLREAIKNKLKISAYYNKNGMVYSFPKNNFKDYFNQRGRHTQSSFYFLLKNKIILAAWHLLNLFMLISPLLILVNSNFIWLFAIKMISDSFIILFVQKKFGYKFSPAEIFYYNILYEIFLIINFFNALFRKIQWK